MPPAGEVFEPELVSAERTGCVRSNAALTVAAPCRRPAAVSALSSTAAATNSGDRRAGGTNDSAADTACANPARR
ncbi:hypothetical protein [Amycolatopsis dendrobii]|uniref:Uncharacterized protein n=1 Tax=Amycolatopsis dendrobii TaxID=2760662 RepID=A0A7W3ZCR8_9PSEU|nr:hypothetical protein [Amycolatopsis dendrobii]MBB1156222.1 hypothetical protein [Amycolatopsis dendrobii]